MRPCGPDRRWWSGAGMSRARDIWCFTTPGADTTRWWTAGLPRQLRRPTELNLRHLHLDRKQLLAGGEPARTATHTAWISTNTGGRYDPVADSWTAGVNAGAPQAGGTIRLSGPAPDDLWGGPDEAAGHGGLYDPVSNTWSPMAAAGAPSARSSHAAVWTGTQMIVWGGNAKSWYLSSGGRYDPATDSWTPTSQERGLPARVSHTAVWTGNVMAISADRRMVAPGMQAGQYDPVIEDGRRRQRSMRRRVARGTRPSGRATGWLSRGGTDGAASLDTGGRYEPVTDTWNAMSIVGAPSPRSRMQLCRAGSRMIVWGGWARVSTQDRGAGTTRSPTSGRQPHPLPLPSVARIHRGRTGNRMVIGAVSGNEGGTWSYLRYREVCTTLPAIHGQRPRPPAHRRDDICIPRSGPGAGCWSGAGGVEDMNWAKWKAR